MNYVLICWLVGCCKMVINRKLVLKKVIIASMIMNAGISEMILSCLITQNAGIIMFVMIIINVGKITIIPFLALKNTQLVKAMNYAGT